MTLIAGIDDNIVGTDRVFYEDIKTDGIEHRGIFYEFNTRYRRETVCLGQYAAITKNDAVISDSPTVEKSDAGISSTATS